VANRTRIMALVEVNCRVPEMPELFFEHSLGDAETPGTGINAPARVAVA